MRRAQTTHNWQRKQQSLSAVGWFPVAPPVYGCELPPVKTLAHKFVRILQRLKKDDQQLVSFGGHWRWSTFNGDKFLGSLRNGVIMALRDLGYVEFSGYRWLLTTAGLRAAKVA